MSRFKRGRRSEAAGERRRHGADRHQRETEAGGGEERGSFGITGLDNRRERDP
jgi:hypothetical protein